MIEINVGSSEFWLGIGGGCVITGYLTQVFKFLLEKLRKKPIEEGWKPVIAFPAALLVAFVLQVAHMVLTNHSLPPEAEPVGVMWLAIPAYMLIFATASAWVYRFFIKKFEDPDKG